MPALNRDHMHAVKQSARAAKQAASKAPKKTQKRSITTQKGKKAPIRAPVTTTSLAIATVAKPKSKAALNKLSKRKFTTAATPEEEAAMSYEAIQELHRKFTSQQKQEYNEWLFAKMSPVIKQSFYASLAISRMQPAQPAMPDDNFISEDLLETLVAHKLLVPVDFALPIPQGHKEDNEKSEILDDLIHILDTFKIIPTATLKKFKKGWINPNIEFDEGFETDPFDTSKEITLSAEELEEGGGVFTIGDTIDACFKMCGLYDVQYFQFDDTDAELELPPRPTNQNAKTDFSKNKVAMFPFHEDPDNVFVRDADEFHAEHLDQEQSLEVINAIHDQFFRYDVVSTLHPDAQEVYDRVIDQIDMMQGDLTKPHKIAGADMTLFKMIIRDFYLQTALYQNYLADPAATTPFYHVNMDFEEQMQGLAQEQDGEFEEEEEAAAAASPPPLPPPKAKFK